MKNLYIFLELPQDLELTNELNLEGKKFKNVPDDSILSNSKNPDDDFLFKNAIERKENSSQNKKIFESQVLQMDFSSEDEIIDQKFSLEENFKKRKLENEEEENQSKKKLKDNLTSSKNLFPEFKSFAFQLDDCTSMNLDCFIYNSRVFIEYQKFASLTKAEEKKFLRSAFNQINF